MDLSHPELPPGVSVAVGPGAPLFGRLLPPLFPAGSPPLTTQRRHAASIFNDNLDGTLTLLKKSKKAFAGMGACVVSQKRLKHPGEMVQPKFADATTKATGYLNRDASSPSAATPATVDLTEAVPAADGRPPLPGPPAGPIPGFLLTPSGRGYHKYLGGCPFSPGLALVSFCLACSYQRQTARLAAGASFQTAMSTAQSRLSHGSVLCESVQRRFPRSSTSAPILR